MAIIKIENLTHTYSEDTPFERVAIRDINFEIEKGEFLGLIGHTGSGKSTLIQHLNGLLKPASGKIYFNGEDINKDKESARQIRFKVGLVFQYPEYQLFEETVYKDIAFGPKNMDLSDDEVDRRVRDAAHFAGVDESLLEKSPFEISGGQKRRVAIAGVIAMEPEVLILDEPTAGLDPRGRDSIIENIKEYHKSKNSTVIMVTHSMEEIARNVERILVMNGGEIALCGKPSEIFSRANDLSKISLSAPEVTRVAMRLRELGLPVDGSVYTIEDAKKAILKLKGGAFHA